MTLVAFQKSSFQVESLINITRNPSRLRLAGTRRKKMLNEVKSRFTGKKQNKTNRLVLSTVVILSLVLSSIGAFAQNNSIKDVTSNKYALQNLIAGIKSDNEGVKRSVIYFTGKYKIAEAEHALIAQLKEEQNPSTRILIALVLFELGSDEGLMYVKELSMEDADAKVRRMSTHIFYEYLQNSMASDLGDQ